MDPSEKARRRKKRDQEVKNKIKNMSKEALAAAISKKKECNARAMLIVEQSLELNVEEPWLLDNLKHINQSHFQDIVEERAITKICGYPLCIEELTNVPKKMYKISTRENKVYDITDRKNYCSNSCYKAGTFLKDQLYTSPLWLRDCEIPVDYQLLPSTKAIKESGAGAEIDLGNTKPVKLDKLNDEKNIIEDIQIKDRMNTRDTTLKHKSPGEQNTEESHKTKHSLELSSLVIKSDIDSKCVNKSNSLNGLDSNHEDLTLSPNEEKEVVLDDKKINKSSINKASDVQKGISNRNSNKESKAYLEKRKTVKKKEELNNQESLSIVEAIEKRIESWFTLDTMIYLLGQEKMREILKISGYSEDVKPKKNDETFHLKCQEIYRKLNILELKDKEKQKPTKSVPDYDALKEETKELEIKVKSFFRGDGKVTFSEEIEKDSDPKDGDNVDVPVLPLIDHCAIMATRRRIFLDKLKKVLPDMMDALELSHFRLSLELQELVATFSFSSTNSFLRPPEWTLVALIIIKLLTIRDEYLNFSYSRELTQRRLGTYLLTYDLDGGYPDRFTSYLMDIERVTSILDLK